MSSSTPEPLEGAYARLPPTLRRDAELTGTGEPLWTPDLIPEVLAWVKAAGLGLEGGEIYLRLGPMQTSFGGDWSTTPQRGPDEPWPDFSRRSTEQGAQRVRSLGVAARRHDPRVCLLLCEDTVG